MPTNNILRVAIQNALRQPKKNLTSLGYAALLLTASASGQTVSESASPANEKITPPTATQVEEPEEVVIVGSRIRRTTFNSPSPVKVITREEATAAGFTNTTEMLQSTAVTSGSSQINNAYGGYVTNGGPGANTISLRGLGAERTLVLINGRRLSPAGSRGGVGSADLNVLPTAIVEHVEVLKDGASSIYGSDAIGGVVNVITMNQVEGANFEVDFHQPTEGSGTQTRFSFSGGLSDDRWSLSGSLDY
ncbi:MAG: TonB-dependent receptor, partial [Sphingobacteriales bacterium]